MIDLRLDCWPKLELQDLPMALNFLPAAFDAVIGLAVYVEAKWRRQLLQEWLQSKRIFYFS